MHKIELSQDGKHQRYEELFPELVALVGGERDLIANLANLAAALAEALTSASWVGFYLMRGGELVLGPFQGRVACTRIAVGRGVCGAAAATSETQVVPDVNAFVGHIGCDSEARSEIVVPILHSGRVVGVLDVDSRQLGAFDAVDAEHLEKLAGLIAELDWPKR